MSDFISTSVALVELLRSIAARGDFRFVLLGCLTRPRHRIDLIWRRSEHLMGEVAAMAEIVYSAFERILSCILERILKCKVYLSSTDVVRI